MRYFMVILTAIHATNCPFTKQIDRDLSTFSCGITKSDMNNLKVMSNIIQYQIISGVLYRSKHCPFPARCVGIERFLLRIAGDVDNVEFMVNVYDQAGIANF